MPYTVYSNMVRVAAVDNTWSVGSLRSERDFSFLSHEMRTGQEDLQDVFNGKTCNPALGGVFSS